jgi:medium-chain acyl-[acyl-carrier-protein] hydrolase
MTAPLIRLFCFPYAGGSARMFTAWQTGLPENVEVVPVEPPGRGSRFPEPLHDRAEPLVDDLLPRLLTRRDAPFALFGHSMGALLAFEIARRLEQRYGAPPLHLFVSAFRAPHLPPAAVPDHTLPDEQFRARLREFKGTPEEVLADEGLMELFVPILRADLAIAGTYRSTGGPPVTCPVTAFAGTEDREVGVSAVAQWSRHTTGGFALKAVPGDHFFLHSHRDLILGEIARGLGAAAPGRAAACGPARRAAG